MDLRGSSAARRRTAAWFDRYALERAWWQARNHYYYDEIKRLARRIIPPGACVLELGCGIGDLLAAVRPSLGVGLDISEQMVQVARRRHAPVAPVEPVEHGQTGSGGHLIFLRGDAHALPLNTRFDYVICSDLLGHVDDIQVLLEALHGVCTPSTKILITYWNFVWHGVMSVAERLGLKMPEAQLNWLGVGDVDNLLFLTNFRTLEQGASLLLPKAVPLLAPLLNQVLIRLPGMHHLALVSHWVVAPAAPRPAATSLSCSVIVPCRNEEGNIAACVDRLPQMGSHIELIFVDGASTDATRERIMEQIARYAGERDIKLLDQVPDSKDPPPAESWPFAATTGWLAGAAPSGTSNGTSNGASNGGPMPTAASEMRPRSLHAASLRAMPVSSASLAASTRREGGRQAGGPVKMLRLGKGDAVRKGFAAASGDVLFILDADLTVPPEELPKFLAPIATGQADFVNGTRLVYPLEDEAMRTANLIGNKFFSVVFTWLLGQRIKDTLCGTKVLRKRDYERLAANRRSFGDFDPFGDFDLLFGAAHLGLRIVEVPVRYRRRTAGYSKVQVYKHGLLLLRMSLIGFRRLKLARWLGRASGTLPLNP